VSEQVIVTNEKTGGAKGASIELFASIPMGALLELSAHYGIGEAKYPTGDDKMPNWRRGYDWSLSFNALGRHAMKFWNGDDYDNGPKGTGSKHIIAVAWHAMTLATFMDEHPELDDRPAMAVRRVLNPAF
jgi:hypothetical protein